MASDPHVHPVRRTRLSQQIVIEICRLIREGAYKVGDGLPPERELAEQFGVSRASLREGLRALEIAGIIETRHGGGTYVRDFSSFDTTSPLMMVLQATDEVAGDLLEVRIIFEPAIAARAAVRATADDVQQLRAILQNQHQYLPVPDNNDRYIQTDRNLHTTIAEISRNKVAVRVIQLINQLLLQERRHFVTSPARRREAYARHVQIVDAIAAGDASSAQESMLRHLREVEAFILGEVIDDHEIEQTPTPAEGGAPDSDHV